MEKQRNGSMDLLKFLFILSITLYHGIKIWGEEKGVIFGNGGSAVEPFYIFAGFFMAYSVKSKNSEPVKYMWGRYKRIFPYHVFAFVIAFFVTGWRHGLFELGVFDCIKEIIFTAIKAIPEFFLLSPLTGLQKGLTDINGIEWYLGAMLIGMAILYPFLRKRPYMFSIYIAPLIFLFGSGILFQTNGSYIATFGPIWIICGGLIRAITILAAGVFTFQISEILKKNIKEKNTFGNGFNIFITIVAILCWVVSFWFFWSSKERVLEFAIVYFMIGGTVLLGSGVSYTDKIFDNRLVHWLAKLSFPMFLNQSWVRKIFVIIPFKDLGFSYAMTMVLFIVAVIVVSVICMLVMDYIMKKFRAPFSCQ